MPITVEDAQRILEADLANILKKIKAGRTLTAAERAVIQSATSRPGPSRGFVGNKVELAEALGASRQAIYNWEKLPGAPEPDAGGRYDVAAWLRFLEENGLQGREEKSTVKQIEEELKLRADRQWKEEKVRIIRKEHMPLALSKSVHAQVILHAKDVLLAKPDVIGLKLSAEFGVDTVRVSQIVRKEIEEALALLAKFEYPK